MDNCIRIATAPLVALAIVMACADTTSGQESASKEPLIGTWKINLAKSSYMRSGKPGPTPADTLTWTYTAEKDGLRMSVYPMGLAPSPARSYFFKWDGKEYPDPQGPGRHETVVFWRMHPNMLTRVVRQYPSDEDRAAGRNAKFLEWVSWAVSPDGKTLAITAWDPEHPEWHNLQVFDRMN
jgi:hypothetical protein